MHSAGSSGAICKVKSGAAPAKCQRKLAALYRDDTRPMYRIVNSIEPISRTLKSRVFRSFSSQLFQPPERGREWWEGNHILRLWAAVGWLHSKLRALATHSWPLHLLQAPTIHKPGTQALPLPQLTSHFLAFRGARPPSGGARGSSSCGSRRTRHGPLTGRSVV